jgi:hypothetical protein
LKILWAQNPLLTVVELDEFDKEILWHRLKIERLEGCLAQGHFGLTVKFNEWRKSTCNGWSLDVAVDEALRDMGYDYVCGDTQRNGKSFDVEIDELTEACVAELAMGHSGDCTCVPCSCDKCHAETLVGVNTINGLGKHEASYIAGAFESQRTLDEAVAHLTDYEPKNVPEWGLPHVDRWREETRRAHEWLLAYRRDHFEFKLSTDATVALTTLAKRPGWFEITMPLVVRQELRAANFVVCNGHGKWRATDDGRTYLYAGTR